MPVNANDSVIWIPRVGAILRTDTVNTIIVQAVADDESTLVFIREAISFELTAAVPQSSTGHRLTLDWEYPSFIPAPLRS